MIARLIRVYTPFIFAIIALIHGVLYFTDYEGILYHVFSDVSGHSVFAILYIMATSKRMCKWYKLTNIFLLFGHVINLLYVFDIIHFYTVLYLGMVINMLAFITFIIFLTTRNIIKVIC